MNKYIGPAPEMEHLCPREQRKELGAGL